jgi:hypothetical protein
MGKSHDTPLQDILNGINNETTRLPEGLSQQVVQTVSENLRSLQVQNFGFDE